MNNSTELRRKIFEFSNKAKLKRVTEKQSKQFWADFMAYEHCLQNEAKEDMINTLKDNIEYLSNKKVTDIQYL